MFLLIGFVVSVLLLLAVLKSAARIWKTSVEFSAERIDKACDAVTSIVSFLVPATLAIATWVFEKIGKGWYGGALALSTGWFVFVLLFTVYIRLNFTWRLNENGKVNLGGGQNMPVIRWLCSVMVGLTIGLVLLSAPIFLFPYQEWHGSEGSGRELSQIHNEYHVNVGELCQPCKASGSPGHAGARHKPKPASHLPEACPVNTAPATITSPNSDTIPAKEK